MVVGSSKAQLQASPANTKLLSLLHFNPEGTVDPTRAVDVAWLPGTNASLFAAAHQSGNIYIYQTVNNPPPPVPFSPSALAIRQVMKPQ